MRKVSFSCLLNIKSVIQVDINDDDIGNIQLVSNPGDETIVGKPISNDWRPIPPIGEHL